jgi:molybdopterin-synthase adenylyltransferase
MNTRVGKSVLIVGAGGLGVPAAIRLAHAGVAHLTLIDPECIELSNLARQVIYRSSDVGVPKAEVAARRLIAKYPELDAEAIVGTLSPDNAGAIIARHDFVIDGTDDPPTKFLISDTCVMTRTPFVYGGVLGFFGQAMTVIPGATACLRCLFEGPPLEGEIATCREAGILGPVAGIIGTIQAEEANLFVGGAQPALCGRILTYDARAGRTRVTDVSPRQGCRCGAFERRAAGPGRVNEGRI